MQAGLGTAQRPDIDPAYLQVQSLSKVYPTDDGPVRALDRVSISQHKGEFVSLVGPSGCGKSTLMMIAAGLVSASDGRVLVDGEPVSKARTDIGIVFQNHVLLDWRTTLQNVLLQAEARNMDMGKAELRARELLAAVGAPVCTENLIRVADVVESPKLAE